MLMQRLSLVINEPFGCGGRDTVGGDVFGYLVGDMVSVRVVGDKLCATVPVPVNK